MSDVQTERPESHTSSSALVVSDVFKSYGGIPVLEGISLAINSGELVALAGENGAGKSTLMKIITGLVTPDKGAVLVGGERITGGPRQARSLGVAIVPQELAPYPDLTIWENLFVGREIRSPLGVLDRTAMINESAEMLNVYGVNVDPRTKMGRLSVAIVQLVEIAKATTWGAKVILLDEPTSAIPEQEVDRLRTVIRKLRDDGVAMLYTTHRMAEIQELSDRVVVLRDGHLVMDAPIADADEDSIVRAMIGRDLASTFPKMDSPGDEPCLRLIGLQLDEGSAPIDLEVRRGEIVGLGGLVGSGRTETLEAIFGLRHAVAGEVKVDDTPLGISPSASIRAGVALVPEDRKQDGLVLTQTVLENTSLPHIDSLARLGWIDRKSRKSAVEEVSSSVRLKAWGMDQPTGTLSGGNQQKVVIARWLTHPPKVLLLDEPTRGVDVGARAEVYQIVRDLAAAGMAVVLVSSDMPELIGMSHRVAVFRDNSIAGELSREALDSDDVQERIFRLASGLDTTNNGGF